MTKRFERFSQSPARGYFIVFGDEDWAAMEAEEAYGNKLPIEIRDLVSLATLYLTLRWPREQSAPRLDGTTTDRLEQIVDLARQLRSELFPPHYWLPEYQADSRPRSAITQLQIDLAKVEDSDHNEFALFLACLNSMIPAAALLTWTRCPVCTIGGDPQ